ncbi:MAG: HupE/UreJ family protein [Verrucomicrobiota bacterium]|nr:HupE/UreJ family protein [Verrucomicrobiota bacterium]
MLGLTFAFTQFACAHSEPTSFLDFHSEAERLEVVLTASTADLAHDLPTIEPSMLLNSATLRAQQNALSEIALSRLRIFAGNQPLSGRLLGAEAVPDRQDLRLTFVFAWPAVPETLRVEAKLFPYDPRHKTFANFYRGDHLERQEVLEGNRTTIEFHQGANQGIWAVVRQFLYEGVHHIFIGPDHILFIIGLLLLGGTVSRLLKIVTAFTVAHSITLALATFGLVNPSPRLIEPLIALSIVFVGVHALLGRRTGDTRMLFAFGFGLVHGFGFASVLREMALPRQALGWSLFSFNAGVEVGQICIVAVVAPLLALVRNRSAAAGERTVTGLAYAVVTAGGFWFFQRLLG